MPAKPLLTPKNSWRERRIAHGMTLKEVADHLGVSPQAVHSVEVRGVGLHRRYWSAVAKLFACSMDDLEVPSEK
jgi:DNA-binding XRE family transcriptional regulator